MKSKKVVNIAGSFRARLLNLARERKEDFQFVLSRWMIERFLYRLSISPHKDHFVLKGAMLFAAWTGKVYRPTRDLDLLGYGSPDIDRLVTAFLEVCIMEGADGLLFEPSRIEGERIREDAEYEGVRLRIPASLDSARQLLQIDVGFGDTVEPPPTELTFPVLLPAGAPRIKVYPPETVVAEKLQAMVQLGIANSRMKDFYDVCTIAESLSFDLPTLARSVRPTFERRRTPVPVDQPFAFTPEFLEDANKRAQWQAFVKRTGLHTDLTLAKMGERIREFLLPVLRAASADSPAARRWEPGGPWRLPTLPLPLAPGCGFPSRFEKTQGAAGAILDCSWPSSDPFPQTGFVLAKLHELADATLVLAEEWRQGTVDRILSKSDLKLGLDSFWSNGSRSP